MFDLKRKEQVPVDQNDPFADIAQTEKIGLGDLVIAAIIGVVVWTLQTLWAPPSINPALWDDVAAASGVRPATHLVGGYFVAFASLIYRTLGFDFGSGFMSILGRAVIVGVAIVSYAALREMLGFIMRARPQRSSRRSLVMQIASTVGALSFVASEPVWKSGQYLSETTVLIALTMLSLEFFFVFLRKGSLKYAYICMVFLGLLTAETPMGFALLIGFLALNNIVMKVLPALESPFFDPAVMAVSKWYMTALFIGAVLVGIFVNCMSFSINDGLVAGGMTTGDLPTLYMSGYAARVIDAASPAGWILWVAVCFAPFMVSMIRFPSAADEETFLPYATGFVFVMCGIITFSQVAPLPVLWFWTHFPVNSEYMLATGILWVATTLAAAVTILGVDALCRNHERLARQIYGSDDEEDAAETVISPLSTAIRRTVVIAIPAVIVLAMIPDRMDTKTRTALGIIKDGLQEIICEAGSADYLFTDGNLDVGIELASRSNGGHLICLPLVSRTADSERDIYLRTRGMEKDEEDLFSFKFDVGMGLRSWIRDRPDHLTKSAVMMGFDLWKRDGKALPPFGGMMSRPTGWTSEEERRASVGRAYELAARVLAMYEMGGVLTDRAVKDALLSVQWRLARMCTYRSEQADLVGDAKTAIAEADMAKRLNAKNETYQDLLAAMSRQNDLMMTRLTPREGLQLALVRADFSMGKMYAETILVADPENADANFAMGMYYVKERQLTRAEEYLKRCLIRRPNEPSIYNNLAMIELELGKLDAAELNARKALKIIPESAAVQDTLKQIQNKREGKTNAVDKVEQRK